MSSVKALFIASLLTLTVSTVAQPSDSQRPDHFKRQPSATREQALSNVAQYNA